MNRYEGSWNIFRLFEDLQRAVRHEFSGLFFLEEAVMNDEEGNMEEFNKNLKRANRHFDQGLEKFIELEFLGWDDPPEEENQQ